jgi:hypothetical protein
MRVDSPAARSTAPTRSFIDRSVLIVARVADASPEAISRRDVDGTLREA